MSWGQIYLLSSRVLKTLCVVLGVLFMGIAAHVWFQGELQKNGAELLVLIPSLSGVVLLVGAATLKVEALRTLLLTWFVGVPALLYLLGWVGCEAHWFSESFCR